MIFFAHVKGFRRPLIKSILLYMKLVFLLTLLGTLHVSGKTLAQVINLKAKNVRLVDAMYSVQEQSGKLFFLQGRAIADIHIDVEIRNLDLRKAMDVLLKDKLVSWELSGETIIIKPRSRIGRPGEELINNYSIIPNSQRTVTGVVKNEKGDALNGVSVSVKGNHSGTTTDENGRFSLQVPANSTTLVFSFVGYSSKEVNFSNNSTINVTLQESVDALDEVVVVGYGVQKKLNLTGSVATVSGDEIAKTPTNNLTNTIGGRMAGISSVNSDGRPGNSSAIRVRGLSTLNDNSPLVVVDGIIRSDGFGNIDPNEVANISVLKDASAAAVYGARAANGVILITTKRGKVGKPVLNYTGMYGLQQPTQYPALMSAFEYGKVRNQAFLNQGYDPTDPVQKNFFYTDEELEDFKQNGTDWYSESFKKQSMQTQHNLSVAGGSESIRYFGSLGYLDQDGIYDNIGFKRFNLRSNIDASITESLTVGLNVDARQELFDSPSWDANDIFHRVINVSPTRKAYYPSGRAANTTGSHPVEMIRSSGYNQSEYNIFQGTLFFNQKLTNITEGLAFNGNFSYFKQQHFNKKFATPYVMYDEDPDGNIVNQKMVGGRTSLYEAFDDLTNYTYNISLNYQRSFLKNDISGLLLFEQYSSKGKGFNANKEDFATNIKDEFFASGPNNQSIGGSGYIRDARRSVVGRFNYAYDGKYLLEGTFRYDGSYRFPKENRFGFFPAISAGWRISEERFFKESSGLNFINNLKLRFSKGLIGNDRVNAYQFQETYSLISGVGPIIDGQAVSQVAYGVYPNQAITWEKQDNTNIGLDINFLNSMFGLEIDYFFRKTSDILWNRDRSVPGTFGRVLPDENYAKVNSNGIELTLTHQKTFASSLSYNFRLVGSYATNKVTQIDDPANALDFDKKLGRPIGFRVGYESLGLITSEVEAASWFGGTQFGQKNLPGDIKYADVNGDGQVTIQDQKVISDYGNEPRIMYGLTGNLTWRKIDLNFFFQGAAQRNLMLTSSGRVMYLNGGSSNNFSYFADSWSVDNPDAKYPLAWIDSRLINNRDSEFWLRKAGYIRLKSLDIGYNFSSQWLSDLRISKLRVYMSGYNLFTISQVKEMDPEAATGAGNYYPQQRNYNLGLLLSF